MQLYCLPRCKSLSACLLKSAQKPVLSSVEPIKELVIEPVVIVADIEKKLVTNPVITDIGKKLGRDPIDIVKELVKDPVPIKLESIKEEKTVSN